jgi:hypothetical protein
MRFENPGSPPPGPVLPCTGWSDGIDQEIWRRASEFMTISGKDAGG